MVPEFFFATKAFVVYNRRVLLIKESAKYLDGTNIGKFDVVGGRVRPGEKFEEGLIREIKEETGLTTIIGRPFFVGEWRPKIREKECQIIGTYFECFANSSAVKLGKDHDEFIWIDPRVYKRHEIISDLSLAFERYNLI